MPILDKSPNIYNIRSTMLLIKTTIGPSFLHGTGLFTINPIKQGDIVWQYHLGLDQRLTAEELVILPEMTQDFLTTYAYKSNISGLYLLCCDHARHMNHSESPNCGERYVTGHSESFTVALRDITAGEELTEDYSSFEDLDDPDNLLLIRSRAQLLKDPRLK